MKGVGLRAEIGPTGVRGSAGPGREAPEHGGTGHAGQRGAGHLRSVLVQDGTSCQAARRKRGETWGR